MGGGVVGGVVRGCRDADLAVGGVNDLFRCLFCFGGGERDLQVSEGISPGVGGGVVRHGEGGLVGEGLEIEGCCAAVGVLFVESVHLFKGRLERRAGEVA